MNLIFQAARGILFSTALLAGVVAGGAAYAQNQAGTTSHSSNGRACSASSVGNCLGCSVSCPANLKAFCTAANSHPQFGCTVTASCSCQDPKAAFNRKAPLFSPVPKKVPATSL